MRHPVNLAVAATCAFMLQAAPAASQKTQGRSNLLPELTLSYVDPNSGDRFECRDDCRRMTVPAGVELEVRVRILGESASGGDDGATWDLWFNQPNHPFPGFSLEPCVVAGGGQLDRGCWEAMSDRVDHDLWDAVVADVVCVPASDADSCREGLVRVVMDPEYGGVRRTGVYHFALWVNRFATVPEWNEFDNFAGPIRVTVEPARPDAESASPAPRGVADQPSSAKERAGVSAPPSLVMDPSSPMPYGVVIVPEEVTSSFSVSSMRSQRLLEFTPAVAGEVEVEVSQTGMYENMIVQVREVSTGEVLVEARDKGRLVVRGTIDEFQLKGDRTFEVVVIPGQGSRGIRGNIRVSYPSHVRYMVDQ